MGAGRKAARGMKAYLRIRDTGDETPVASPVESFFGIDLRERNYARIRAI